MSEAKKIDFPIVGEEEERQVAAILARLTQSERQVTKEDVMRGFSLKLTKGDTPVGRLHYTVIPSRDPDINPQWKIDERKSYTSQAAWDREQEIIDEAGGGELVFADTLLTHWDKIIISDPHWMPDPEWDVSGGFDYGKTNPTCCERVYHTHDGRFIFAGEYYQPGREIWQHAPVLRNMRDFSRIENVYADPSMFNSGQEQSQKPGHAAEVAKTFNELYMEAGVTNLVKYYGDRSDVSFAGRLHMHWANLEIEGKMPTVQIVCRNYSEQPVPGLHQWDCPNLVWELMNTRRVKLNAQQLLSRNVSEAIIDKDNHARDAMKYFLMSYPEPTAKTLERRVNERVAELAKKDPTVAVANYNKIVAEESEEDESQYYGRNGRRRIQEAMRRRRRLGGR